MPNFALDVKLNQYDLGSGRILHLTRPHVLLVPRQRGLTRVTCFVDTGAALSVVSFGASTLFPPLTPISVPSSIRLTTPTGRLVSVSAGHLLDWRGQNCRLAETEGEMLDRQSRTRSGPLRFIAKFVPAPFPFENDQFVILGTQFMQERTAEFFFAGLSTSASGRVLLP
jgi:hypothetical protein